MTEYVIVYVKHPVTKEGLFILKDKPAYLADRINLLGGHVEEGETVIEGGRREIKEESGLDVGQVRKYGAIVGDNFIVHCLRAYLYYGSPTEINPREGETETVFWDNIAAALLNDKLMGNLRVIIPLLEMEISGWELSEDLILGYCVRMK